MSFRDDGNEDNAQNVDLTYQQAPVRYQMGSYGVPPPQPSQYQGYHPDYGVPPAPPMPSAEPVSVPLSAAMSPPMPTPMSPSAAQQRVRPETPPDAITTSVSAHSSPNINYDLVPYQPEQIPVEKILHAKNHQKTLLHDINFHCRESAKNKAMLSFKHENMKLLINLIQVAIILLSTAITFLESIKTHYELSEVTFNVISICFSTSIALIMALYRFFKVEERKEAVKHALDNHALIINKFRKTYNAMEKMDIQQENFTEWDKMRSAYESEIFDSYISIRENFDTLFSFEDSIYYKNKYKKLLLKLSFINQEIKLVHKYKGVKHGTYTYYFGGWRRWLCCGFGRKRQVKFNQFVRDAEEGRLNDQLAMTMSPHHHTPTQGQGQGQDQYHYQNQYHQMFNHQYGASIPRPRPRPLPTSNEYQNPYHRTPEYYTEEEPDVYESKFSIVLKNQKTCILTIKWDMYQIQVMNSDEDIGEQDNYFIGELSKADINRTDESVKLIFETPTTEVGWNTESDSDGDVVMGEPLVRVLDIESIMGFNEFMRSLNYITDEYENRPIR